MLILPVVFVIIKLVVYLLYKPKRRSIMKLIQKKYKFIVLSIFLLFTTLSSLSVPTTKVFADEVADTSSIVEKNETKVSFRYGGLAWALQSLGGSFAKSPTFEQINGKYRPPKHTNCGPYGTGGTPNSCNM